MSATDSHRAIEAVWRIESARLIAGLTRIVRDVGIAEDLAQEALLAALRQWPADGIPVKPGAWLMATAKHRAMDHFRRVGRTERKYAELGHQTASVEAEPDDDLFGDDLLRLMFIACHPVLSPEARAALTLRLIGGLTTEEIARAFLIPAATVAQRIVRAKKALAEKRIPFEIPGKNDVGTRLDSVLEVIYLIFNEGYAATSGGDWMRPALCEDALRLGRILAELTPTASEVHGLVALMEIQASRTRARTGPDGRPVLLFDQDRSRWDRLLIRRGLAALARAARCGGERGAYVLQAELAACHARAGVPSETDWHGIVALYVELSRVAPSPVVLLNHAVAVSMASGPLAGLGLVDALRSEAALRNYHLMPAVRGDFLARLERHAEACAEFERAAALTQNERERALLLERAAASRRLTSPLISPL